jgi:ubiquinone/menaquinone biosynthesis C-methylase UbiE
MSEGLQKFQCPACTSGLAFVGGDIVKCAACGREYGAADDILDFVGGRFDTLLDVEHYDDYHAIDDSGAEIQYLRVGQVAAHRWPASLGSVVEIGCGTGSFSRAMIAHRAVDDAVLTDVSTGMLKLCRQHLQRIGIASTVPLTFATYSANEACFRDAVFDTCLGSSVVHHITDVRGFLAEVFRMLKPGGRAFFIEPTLRYHQVVAMAFADILAFLLARNPIYLPERQIFHNWIAEARKGFLHQGDLEFLATCEDKHMFIGEAFEAMALEVGFATAEALPSTPDPDGLNEVAGLLAGLRVGEELGGQIESLWPNYSRRYLSLLHQKDQSLGFLLWLTKPIEPRGVTASQPQAAPDLTPTTEAAITGGGMPIRCDLKLTARAVPGGIMLKIIGWCLAGADLKSVRVTIDGVSRRTPVWLPRADIQLALNNKNLYPAWNALCCGIDAEMMLEGASTTESVVRVELDLIFANFCFVRLESGAALRLGEPFDVGR